jgi:hypothetical protein
MNASEVVILALFLKALCPARPSSLLVLRREAESAVVVPPLVHRINIVFHMCECRLRLFGV